MADNKKVLRAIASMFVKLPPEPEPPPEPIDPDAIAELDGSLVIGRRRDAMATQAPPPVILPDPTDPDGHVDFPVLYARASVPAARFTAEQAIEAIGNVERTMPSSIADDERRPMIKGMLEALGKSTTGATPEAIALDAQNKIDAITAFVRRRSSDLVDLQQTADEAIAALESQIADRRREKELASKQFDTLSSECSAEQTKLNGVIDLLALPPRKR